MPLLKETARTPIQRGSTTMIENGRVLIDWAAQKGAEIGRRKRKGIQGRQVDKSFLPWRDGDGGGGGDADSFPPSVPDGSGGLARGRK